MLDNAGSIMLPMASPDSCLSHCAQSEPALIPEENEVPMAGLLILVFSEKNEMHSAGLLAQVY